MVEILISHNCSSAFSKDGWLFIHLALGLSEMACYSETPSNMFQYMDKGYNKHTALAGSCCADLFWLIAR